MRAWFSHGWFVACVGVFAPIALILLSRALESPIWLVLVLLPLSTVASVPLGSAFGGGRHVRRLEHFALGVIRVSSLKPTSASGISCAFSAP